MLKAVFIHHHRRHTFICNCYKNTVTGTLQLSTVKTSRTKNKGKNKLNKIKWFAENISKVHS